MSKSYILYFFGFGKSLSEVAQIMLEKGVDTMPVLENDKLVGIIIERDFFKLVT
jgi:CBS domain-containing protein